MFDPVFSKVLVAYDGSDPSKRALDHAAKMGLGGREYKIVKV